MISLTSSFEINNVIVTDPNIFWWIAASVADAAAVNPNSMKALLAKDLNSFFIKGNPDFSIGPKSQPKNPPDCTILYNRK